MSSGVLLRPASDMWEARSTRSTVGGVACRRRGSCGAAESGVQESKPRRSARLRPKRIGTGQRNGCGSRSERADTDLWSLTRTFLNMSGIETKVARIGLVCASIQNPEHTRVGRSTRKNGVRFAIDWVSDGPNACAEERATLCDLQIYIGEKNVCRHSSASSRKYLDHLTIPAVHLAEGLATDWWAIFGGRDQKHSVLRYGMGFALPKLSLSFDGSLLEVVGSKHSYENPDVNFLVAEKESIPGDFAESILAGYIELVLDKLSSDGVDSEVATRWSRVSASRNDPDERVFCETAGALGVDPYLISDADAQFIEDARNLFADKALIEFLAGIRRQNLVGRRELLRWARESEALPQDTTRLPDLPAIASQIGQLASWSDYEQSWAGGYRAARALRAEITADRSERLTSTATIAERLGADHFASVPGPAGALAVVARNRDEVHVHLRRHISSEQHRQNFAFARAIGDAVCFPNTPLSVVNDLHQAERQAAGRAFGAEFLAPVESILDMVDSGCGHKEIAKSFNVSRKVVEHQITNRERIRQSCTALAT